MEKPDMCLAFPGKILNIDGQHALADFDGVQKKINISLIDNPKIGDYVIVHTGFAVEKLNKQDAWKIIEIYDQGKKN